MSSDKKAPKNCWEILKCGREPGGDKVDEAGICPAAVETSVDGYNDGENAGRYCWRVAGTFCDDEVQGSFTHKVENCAQCKVFKRIVREQGRKFKL